MCHDPDFRGKFRIVLHPNTQKADFAADSYPRTGIFGGFGPVRGYAMCHDPKKQPKIRIVLHIQGRNHPLHAPAYERPRCNRPKQTASPESEADPSNSGPAASNPANQTTQTQQPNPANPTVNGLPSPTGYPPDTCRNPVRSTAPHRTRNRCRAIPAARAPLRTGSPATPPR